MDRLLLRPLELQESMSLSRGRIYQLLASGQLPSVRIGRSIRVPARALERWIELNCRGAEQNVTKADPSDSH